MTMYCTNKTSPILAKQLVSCTLELNVGFLMYQVNIVPCVNMCIHQFDNVLQFVKAFSFKLPTFLVHQTFLSSKFFSIQ